MFGVWCNELQDTTHTAQHGALRAFTDFICCFNPDNRYHCEETEQFRAFDYDTLMQRDTVSLDIFWLKDDSLEELEHLPTLEIIAREIAENLQVVFSQFDSTYADLTGDE